MKLKQLSLFLENKSGTLREACRTLADNEINVETMTLAETEQFGVLRILTKDWQRAKEVFGNSGKVMVESDVVALVVGHHPGSLASILDVLDGTNLNIEYMYGFSQRVGLEKCGNDIADGAIIVFRFNDPDAAVDVLLKANIQIIKGEELFR